MHKIEDDSNYAMSNSERLVRITGSQQIILSPRDADFATGEWRLTIEAQMDMVIEMSFETVTTGLEIFFNQVRCFTKLSTSPSHSSWCQEIFSEATIERRSQSGVVSSSCSD